VEIAARVRNAGPVHEVQLRTDAHAQSLVVDAKAGGPGSSVNGGEFLMLALATCYCNDLYREAARRGITVTAVEVEARADFDGVGLAARNVRYRAAVQSPASSADIDALLRETDAVAEVHNTLRTGVPVTLERP
jgi:organic hydroperoxide reductase OsmC/OhrA